MSKAYVCNFISLNVRGIREKNKRQNIFKWCKDKNGHVIFLQETFSTEEIVSNWDSMWEGKCIYSHGTNHGKGVMILFGKGVDIKLKHTIIDSNGRYIFAVGLLQNQMVVLGNVYFPVGSKDQEQLDFLHNISLILEKKEFKNKPFIMGGDFNMTRDVYLDYKGSNINKRQSKLSIEFDKFLNNYKAIDIWRFRNANKIQYTYHQQNPYMQSRLDYWVISDLLVEKVSNCEIIPSLSPDHSAIQLNINFAITNPIIKTGYWKFNNSLCQDEEYVKRMKEEIIRLKLRLSEEIIDNRILWDYVKMEIRNFTRKYSKKKAKERKEKVDRLEKEIIELEEKVQLQTPTNRNCDLTDTLTRKRNELKTIYGYLNDGIKIRSRAQWFESGERETAYFKQLIDSNGRKGFIKELKVNGNIINDEISILKEIRVFYSTLYSKRDIESDENIFFPNSLLKLNENQKNQCEGKINQGDCIGILKEMQLNKSPGNDGLNVEFYITFWQEIGDLVLNAFNDAIKYKELSPSQKQAIITIIHKEGKDPMSISNYRPISLLNVDYKILTKILSKRIKTILNNVVSVDQVGYLNDRNIGEAVRMISDIIFHTSNFNKPGYLVAIDFEKAFDSISHTFLQRVLKSFGFGSMFTDWVNIIYTNTQSCVFNGGKSTGYFKIERGLRQGDPLSPYLFILCIECLTHCIRNDNLVKGIRFGETEIKQILYADDMTIFVEDLDSIYRLDIILENFRRISGLRINKNKTFILPLGPSVSLRHSFPFGKQVDMVKILGIIFSLNPDVAEEMNYKEILSKIKRLLNWWKQRDLTLIGKIHLLKTYAYSKLIYVSSLTPVPEWAFKEIDEICFDFLWRGKDKIKRNTLYLDYKHGGLKMLNFKLFVMVQRVMWVKRLVNGNQRVKWKKYFKFLLRPLGGNLIFYCNFTPDMISIKLPKYYQEMLSIWYDINVFIKKDTSNKRNEIFFNNRYIQKEGKSYFHQNIFLKNTYKLHHIVDEKGELKSNTYFRSMGLNVEEITTIQEIFAHTPVEWKVKLGRNTLIDGLKIEFIFFKNVFQFESVCSKKLYRACIQKMADIPVSFRNLESSYNMSEKEIERVFYRPRFCTLDNKLREFQFKLLYNIVFVNHHLYRFQFITNNECSFCGKEEETYRHIFYDCEMVKELWELCSNLLKFPILKDLQWKDIHIGLEETAENRQLLNHIILLIKFLIYHGRGENKLPTVDEIHAKLIKSKDEEKKIAIERKTLTRHYKKWEYLKVLNDNQSHKKDDEGMDSSGLPMRGDDRSVSL